MSRHASQATKPVPMPTEAVHPLETVRRGCFDWWSVAAMALGVVVPVVAVVALTVS